MRTTIKQLTAAIEALNSDLGFTTPAGVFDSGARVSSPGFALYSQDLRAAGDRHNRYQLHWYAGESSGCSDVSGTYSLTLSEIFEKVCAMRSALRAVTEAPKARLAFALKLQGR